MSGMLIVPVFASLKHPVHGRNQRTRPITQDNLYYQLDNTDRYKDNIVPINYRKRSRHGQGNIERGAENNRKLTTDWMTWDEAETEGRKGPLRVTWVTEFIDSGNDVLIDTEHCVAAAQQVRPDQLTDNSISGNLITCTEDDVVDTTTIGIVKQRLNWTSQYIGDTFTVKQGIRSYFLL